MRTIGLDALPRVRRGRRRQLCTLFRVAPRQGAAGVVVLVHGLGGHPWKTWRRFPELLLTDDSLRPPAEGTGGWDVAVCDHSPADSGLRHLLDRWLPLGLASRPFDFEDKFRELRGELVSLRRVQQYEHIMLVGHSLGGILVLGTLRDLFQAGDPECNDTLRSISKLAFFGTPFLGSDRLRVDVGAYAGDVAVLKQNHTLLTRLSEWMDGRMTGHLLRLRDSYARIGLVYSTLDRWVDPSSAQGKFPSDLAEQISTTHERLVKPEDRQQRAYVFLASLLLEPPEAGRQRHTAQGDGFIEFRGLGDDRLGQARELYERSFQPEERVAWELLVPAADANNRETVKKLYALAEPRRVQAFASLNLQRQFGLAWFGYVASEGRAGAGSDLIDLVLEDLLARYPRCRAVFFEVERPNAPNLEPTERQKRQARIRLFARYRPYWVKGVDYRQPALEPPGRRSAELPLYLAYLPLPPTTRLTCMHREEVAAILQAIQQIQLVGYPEVDEATRAYGRYLDDWRARTCERLPSWIELVPLAARSVQNKMGALEAADRVHPG